MQLCPCWILVPYHLGQAVRETKYEYIISLRDILWCMLQVSDFILMEIRGTQATGQSNKKAPMPTTACPRKSRPRNVLTNINNLRNSAIQSEKIIFYFTHVATRVIIRAQWLQIVMYWLQIVMSWVPSVFSLKTRTKHAYCTAHTSVYQFTWWSSCLDRSKFSHRDR